MRSVLVVVISRILGYISFFVNIPYAFAFLGMFLMIISVLENVYGVRVFGTLEFSFTFDTSDFLRFYTAATFVLYVIVEAARAVFRITSGTFRQRFQVFFLIATLGWGFLIVHVPFMNLASGSSRVELAGVFFFFYVMTLASFALGGLIEGVEKRLIDRIQKQYPVNS